MSERAYTVTRAVPSPACVRMVFQTDRSGVQDFSVEKAYRDGFPLWNSTARSQQRERESSLQEMEGGRALGGIRDPSDGRRTTRLSPNGGIPAVCASTRETRHWSCQPVPLDPLFPLYQTAPSGRQHWIRSPDRTGRRARSRKWETLFVLMTFQSLVPMHSRPGVPQGVPLHAAGRRSCNSGLF